MSRIPKGDPGEERTKKRIGYLLIEMGVDDVAFTFIDTSYEIDNIIKIFLKTPYRDIDDVLDSIWEYADVHYDDAIRAYTQHITTQDVWPFNNVEIIRVITRLQY